MWETLAILLCVKISVVFATSYLLALQCNEMQITMGLKSFWSWIWISLHFSNFTTNYYIIKNANWHLYFQLKSDTKIDWKVVANIFQSIVYKILKFPELANHYSIQIKPMHRGAICQFPVRWIYYCHSSESTSEKTNKTHLCSVHWSRYLIFEVQSLGTSCSLRFYSLLWNDQEIADPKNVFWLE